MSKNCLLFPPRCACVAGKTWQFLDESPGDADFEQALEENQTVLTKKRLRAKALRNALADLRSARPHLSEPTTEYHNGRAVTNDVDDATLDAADNATSISSTAVGVSSSQEGSTFTPNTAGVTASESSTSGAETDALTNDIGDTNIASLRLHPTATTATTSGDENSSTTGTESGQTGVGINSVDSSSSGVVVHDGGVTL